MEERIMNGLVPPDQLHWSDDLKCYTIISQKETDELIEACFRTGIKDAKQILNVVKEYEKVRSGQLLFGQFLAGNIGIYEFEEDGSPVFESIRKESIREITFDSRVEAENENAESVYGRSVTCSTAGGESIAFYRAIVDFCSKWGIDILAGENPEEEAITREDPDFIADMRRRSWRVVEVENAGPSTRIRVMFTGDWLRTDHAS
jgi:hypothetical protein